MAKRERRARIAFIGGGAMGEAMIRGILTKKVAIPQDMVVSDVSPIRRELLNKKYGLSTLADNRKAMENADLIVLAVKPQNLRQVAEEIRAPSPEQLVLSILAGGTLSKLCQDLNHSCVVRAAPNMPAQIGQGITVWTATAETNKKQKELAQAVLSALGKEIYVADEKYLDMVTALGGSGAAYVFLFIEAFIDAGVHIGLPRSIAQEVVLQTMIGSTCAVEKMGKHPAELKNMVTSPGGTTTEALLQLEKGAFRYHLLEAVAAAHAKAQRL
ncbi:MAG: pyrroline-5-carboxylate reductase [Dehalococcoidia bacterium]|nr:MAG: pyrroline-5-carboxylate reductase [Dehalococcoidia bacterium]